MTERADGPVVAAIDCGTNTVKLLIGALPDVAVREARMVRLGEGVDRTGALSPAALERTFAALDEYADLLAAHDVSRLRFCATSATRDAANAELFADGVEERLGIRPEVLSGAEEAALSYAGAVRGLAGLPALLAPVLVVDIGGGSTELVLGGDDVTGVVAQADSLQVGSVRLHERHLHDDPPTRAQVEACTTELDAALAGCPVDVARARTVVGVAGTVTTVAAGVLDLDAYDRDAIDRAVLDVDAVQQQAARLLAMGTAERRGLPWLHPGRVDVIGAGALVLSRVLAHARPQRLVVSESDILDGIAWSLTDRRDDAPARPR